MGQRHKNSTIRNLPDYIPADGLPIPDSLGAPTYKVAVETVEVKEVEEDAVDRLTQILTHTT